MKSLTVIDWVALVLVIVGGLNWGLVGLFKFNIVEVIFRFAPIIINIVYIIVGIAAIYLAVIAIKLQKSV
ncbi:MAG: hypothetical protein K0S11_1677 [Gammaproteobacteria bacterium]|jgi:uncharacterized membrane protein YuzA (DUF378 family)|nr:hypothetical protein [Gammaproteobacteria bacterium]